MLIVDVQSSTHVSRCDQRGNVRWFVVVKLQTDQLHQRALADILSTGVIGKPDADGGIWCSTKVNGTLTPMPGEVMLFLKNLHGGSSEDS